MDRVYGNSLWKMFIERVYERVYGTGSGREFM
jgi:hypothetical protein